MFTWIVSHFGHGNGADACRIVRFAFTYSIVYNMSVITIIICVFLNKSACNIFLCHIMCKDDT